MKHRRRNRIIGREVPVVPVPKAEMPSRHQSAGPHPELQVKGMVNEAIFDRQTWQKTWLSFAPLGLAWRADAHA